MKAISLWQPWASLIALGHKRIETRSWSTSYRGPLAIHASKRVNGRRGERWPIGDFEVERDASGYLLRGPIEWPYRLPLGEVVATADLVNVVPTETVVFYANTIELSGMSWFYVSPGLNDEPHWVEADASQEPFGDFGPGRFAWLLNNVRPVRPSVPAVGRQGLWEWEVAHAG